MNRRDFAIHVLNRCRIINVNSKPPVVQAVLLLTMAEHPEEEWSTRRLADLAFLSPFHARDHLRRLAERGLVRQFEKSHGFTYRLSEAGKREAARFLNPALADA